jgi:glycerophosphoryl diester phosphodiesterase
MLSVQRLILLGHRGDRRLARENTIAAFDRALENGCDGFEFDVRLTLDGQAVVFHDPKISGVAFASSPFSRLAALDAARAICDRLCLLDDIMARYAPGAFLDIELKVPGLESKLIELLKQYPPKRGYIVSSFLPEIIEALAEREPTLPLGFIVQSRQILPRWRALPVEYLIANYRLVTADLVKACHDAQRKILVWTVNKPSSMRGMANLGVDGIISDDTKLMVSTLGQSR